MALARWYKIDFHTHTPASNCFPDKSISADEWLMAAKESGMNAVVVTDHNSVEFISEIEKVKHNYEVADPYNVENNFKVFYGIELCVSAEFTHMIIIFDDSLSITQVEDALISHLGLKRGNWGNTEINVTEDKLKELCTEMKDKIFVIPAHFFSNKGLGKCNVNAIKKYEEFVRFSAIEVRNEEDVKEYNNKLRLEVINQAVCISGSDNPSSQDISQHSIEGFGKIFTWVKLSSLNFEGLKQVFIDPENRCLNWPDIQHLGISFNPNDVNYNYISGINLQKFSHLADLNLRLSPYLNCIVGGRGTGKSTLVNAINYGLNPNLALDRCKILSKTMTKDGKIDVFFNFGSSNPYQITAEKESIKKLRYSFENSLGKISDPPEFRVDFYGQKEIFNLIEDEDDVNENGKSPLVKLIDDKINTKLYGISDEIELSLTELLSLSEEYKNNRRKIKEIPTIKAEISKINSILKKYEESGLEETRKRREKIYEIDKICSNEINTGQSYFEDIVNTLQIKIEGIKKVLSEITTEKVEVYNDFKKLLEDVENSYDSLRTLAKKQIEEFEKIRSNFNLSNIVEEKVKVDNEYKFAVEKVKNTGSEDIETLQDKLQENKLREIELLTIIEKQNILNEKIKEAISNYLRARLRLTEERKEVICSLELDNIKINISPICHKCRWKQSLQKEFGRENTFDSEFEKLVDYILDGNDDFNHYKEFIFFLVTSEDGNISEYCHEISNARFINIWADKQKNDTLSSIVKVIPEDMITIKIQEETGDVDINEGSPGQKSAAVLAFILSSGENPLIIDQPEDDLDNSLIYNLIVKSIRKMKNKRQIIIVTHNPNIPVLGDAEGIVVLERNAEGKVDFRNNKKAGCLEEKVIREGICDIMEGGEGAFKKREEKYLYRW